MSYMNFRIMTQIFLDDQKKRKSRRFWTTRFVFIYTVMLIHTSKMISDMAKWLKQDTCSWQLEKRHYVRLAIQQSPISPWKGKRKKEKEQNCYNTGYSFLVLQAPSRTELTCWANKTRCCPCGITLRWIFFVISKISQNKGNKRRKISLITLGKIRNEKIGVRMRARLYLLCRSDKKKTYLLYDCLGRGTRIMFSTVYISSSRYSLTVAFYL